MDSIVSRVSTLCTSTSTALGLLMLLCYLSTAFDKPSVPVVIHVQRVAVDSGYDYSLTEDMNNDMGSVMLDLEASFDKLFNWNVKELFLYLVAEYETESNLRNEVVLWDKIILRGSNAKLSYKGIGTKYQFWDDGHGLRGNQNITLKLYCNTVPTVGTMEFFTADGSDSFAFPNRYIERRQ